MGLHDRWPERSSAWFFLMVCVCGIVYFFGVLEGIGVGIRLACGWSERKLHWPVGWRNLARSRLRLQTYSKLIQKNRDLIKSMTSFFLEDPELMMATTAALSQWHTNLWPFQYLPHIVDANAMGSSSFEEIFPCGSANQQVVQVLHNPRFQCIRCDGLILWHVCDGGQHAESIPFFQECCQPRR